MNNLEETPVLTTAPEAPEEGTTAAAPAAPKAAPARKRRAPSPTRPKINRKLTPEQKAEAAALWRAGSVTLDDLSKKYGKRPENFSRLFRKMGIVKGSAIAETAARVAEEVAKKAGDNVAKELERLQKVKDEHFAMSSALAKIAFAEITRARQAGTKIDSLKDTMMTLKLAGEIVGTSRKELYAILRAEMHDDETDADDLPELQVAELTPDQITQMQAAPVEFDDDGILEDLEPPAEGAA